MQIKVTSIVSHGNGNRDTSTQVLFKVVRHREYKNMMATIFYSGDEIDDEWDLDTPVNVVNLGNLTDKLDADYFKLVHKAVTQWDKSWSWGDTNDHTQQFPFIVGE